MYRWFREVHLFVGLLAFWFLLMYCLSSIRMTHSSWFSDRIQWTEREVEVGTFNPAPGRALALVLLQQHGLRGELRQVTSTDSGFRLEIERPGVFNQVEYSRETGRARIRSGGANFMQVLAGIQEIVGLRHETSVYDVWGMSALIVSIAFALLGLTGIYLWFHFHKERKIGAILLGLNLAYSLGLIVLIRIA
jgi:hypothetical protein